MARDFARAFYSSGAWRSVRDSYRRYRHGLCEECLKRGIVTAGTEVHHIIAITPDNIGNPDVTLNFDNLKLLCKNCHEVQHKGSHTYGRRRERRRYQIGADGRVTAIT